MMKDITTFTRRASSAPTSTGRRCAVVAGRRLPVVPSEHCGSTKPRRFRPDHCGSLTLVAERNVHPRPILDHFAIFEAHIELFHLANAQVMQVLGGLLNSVLSRFLPRRGAGAD